MWEYQSSMARSSAPPLVVVLHGCKQSAHDYAADSGWLKYARRFAFNLLLPEQKSGWFGNNELGCFNWFYRGDQEPEGGETLSIKQMIDFMVEQKLADPKRIYITGLSAGGAMTAVMLASYPGTFAGGGIVAGVPYGCSRVPAYVPRWWLGYGWNLSYTGPYRCMNPGLDLSATQWGNKIRALHRSVPSKWPRISIWHGKEDKTVAVRNAMELAEQWTNLHNIKQLRSASQPHDGYDHIVYLDAAGQTAVELFLLNGFGHGQPIKPDDRWFSREKLDECGRTSKFMLKSPLCASFYMARLWELLPAN